MTYSVLWKDSPSAPWTICACYDGEWAEERAQARVGCLWADGYWVRLEVNS